MVDLKKRMAIVDIGMIGHFNVVRMLAIGIVGGLGAEMTLVIGQLRHQSGVNLVQGGMLLNLMKADCNAMPAIVSTEARANKIARVLTVESIYHHLTIILVIINTRDRHPYDAWGNRIPCSPIRVNTFLVRNTPALSCTDYKSGTVPYRGVAQTSQPRGSPNL